MPANGEATNVAGIPLVHHNILAGPSGRESAADFSFPPETEIQTEALPYRRTARRITDIDDGCRASIQDHDHPPRVWLQPAAFSSCLRRSARRPFAVTRFGKIPKRAFGDRQTLEI